MRNLRRMRPVDGDPLANISLIADPAANLVLIMKDGEIYKNRLP